MAYDLLKFYPCGLGSISEIGIVLLLGVARSKS